ncbi:MAG: type II toxin-antitoxin system HicB family antitoxin [Candidatus Rokuibacteriota bacterium]
MLIEAVEEGGFVVTCPALPGVVTQGETLDEARAMAVAAIRGYLESLMKGGQLFPPIPQPSPSGRR